MKQAKLKGGQTMRFDKKYKPELGVSKDITREHLTGVRLDVEAGLLISTNGHYLTAIECTPEDGDTSATVTTDAITSARKLAGRGEPASIAVNDKAKLTNGAEMPLTRNQQFPPWQQVVKGAGGETPVSVAFSGKYLKQIIEALGNADIMLEINPDDQLQPIMIRALGKDFGVQKSYAVLMPMRTDAATKAKIDGNRRRKPRPR